MRNFDRKYSLIAAVFAAVLLTLAVGCKGFFVNQPNSVAVTTAANGGGSSSFTVAAGSTVQLFATATYSDGNKDVTNSATWQSSTPCVTVAKGTVKGIGAITGVTISASLGGVAGSATGTVTGGSGQALVISSTPSGTTFTQGTQAVFTATLNNVDVTASTTWTSSNSSIITFNGNTATFAGTGTATITGSYVNGNTCAGASEDVTVQ